MSSHLVHSQILPLSRLLDFLGILAFPFWVQIVSIIFLKKEANSMIFEQVNIANDEQLAEENILKIIKNPSSNHRYKALPQ